MLALLKKKNNKEATYTVDDEISRIVNEMKDVDVLSDDYKKMTERLEVLTESRQETIKKPGLSKDQLFSGVISVLELILIMNFERLHVFSGKAFNVFHRLKMK